MWKRNPEASFIVVGLIVLGVMCYLFWYVIPNTYLTAEYIDPEELEPLSWESVQVEVVKGRYGEPPGICWNIRGESVCAYPSASEKGVTIHWGRLLIAPLKSELSSGHPIGFWVHVGAKTEEKMLIFKVERQGDRLFVFEGRK